MISKCEIEPAVRGRVDSSDENRDDDYRSQAGTENGSVPRRKVVHAQPVEEDIQATAKFLSNRKIQDPSKTHHWYRFIGIYKNGQREAQMLGDQHIRGGMLKSMLRGHF